LTLVTIEQNKRDIGYRLNKEIEDVSSHVFKTIQKVDLKLREDLQTKEKVETRAQEIYSYIYAIEEKLK
jgi:hypothetical protein